MFLWISCKSENGIMSFFCASACPKEDDFRISIVGLYLHLGYMARFAKFSTGAFPPFALLPGVNQLKMCPKT